MQSNCPAAKGRPQLLFFFRQRRRKILFRRELRSEIACSAGADWIRAAGLDQASNDSQWENTPSRLGWGITHI
jgi:hypothetical protein